MVCCRRHHASLSPSLNQPLRQARRPTETSAPRFFPRIGARDEQDGRDRRLLWVPSFPTSPFFSPYRDACLACLGCLVREKRSFACLRACLACLGPAPHLLSPGRWAEPTVVRKPVSLENRGHPVSVTVIPGARLLAERRPDRRRRHLIRAGQEGVKHVLRLERHLVDARHRHRPAGAGTNVRSGSLAMAIMPSVSVVPSGSGNRGPRQ